MSLNAQSASRMAPSDTPPHAQAFNAIIPGTSQVRTLGASSQQSSAFQSTTSIVHLVCDTDCFVAFGANPTATTASMYLVAKIPYLLGVTPGQKLAALQAGSGGNLYITEGA